MKCPFNKIGAIFVALNLAVLSLAAEMQIAEAKQNVRITTDTGICWNALNSERSGWDKDADNSDFVAEAVRRALSITNCRQKLGQSDVVMPTTLADHTVCENALNREQLHWAFENGVAEAVRRGFTLDACRQLVQDGASSVEKLSADTVCINALNRERTAWDQSPTFSKDVAEAAKRGLTIDACRQMVGPPIVMPTPTSVNLSDSALCLNALNREQREWDSDPIYSKYIAEASRRGFTVKRCRQLTGEEQVASTDSGTSEQRAFLEAALFFITGVDTTEEDVVTNREIRLRREPLVAYLVDGKPCVVRLRNTNNNTLWQMDFCKITKYQYSPPGIGKLHGNYLWDGKQDAFCVSWERVKYNENYTDPDFAKIATECGTPSRTVVYNSYLDIGWFVDKGGRPRGGRSLARMVGAFNYIVTLLTPPEQRKPY